MKKAAVLLAVLLLAGCSSAPAQQEESHHQSDQSSVQDAAAEVGIPKTVNGYTITVNSLTQVKGDLDQDHPASTLASGNQYEICDITVENHSGSEGYESMLTEYVVTDEEGKNQKRLPLRTLQDLLLAFLKKKERITVRLPLKSPWTGSCI